MSKVIRHRLLIRVDPHNLPTFSPLMTCDTARPKGKPFNLPDRNKEYGKHGSKGKMAMSQMWCGAIL
jgi:hypothetical protein